MKVCTARMLPSTCYHRTLILMHRKILCPQTRRVPSLKAMTVGEAIKAGGCVPQKRESTAIMIDSGESCVITTVLMYFSIVYLVVLCKGKKKEMPSSGGGSSDSGSLPKPRAPQQKGMAGTFDPNYQTLANVQDPFAAPGGTPGAAGVPGAAPPQPPKPPAAGGMAGTFDPNYQTLANIQGDVFGADKAAGVGAAAAGKGDVPAPAGPPQIKPGTGGVAGTYDPNYQTLAGMNADVFGKDKKAA